jgi:hypothetical protein
MIPDNYTIHRMSFAHHIQIVPLGTCGNPENEPVAEQSRILRSAETHLLISPLRARPVPASGVPFAAW